MEVSTRGFTNNETQILKEHKGAGPPGLAKKNIVENQPGNRFMIIFRRF